MNADKDGPSIEVDFGRGHRRTVSHRAAAGSSPSIRVIRVIRGFPKFTLTDTRVFGVPSKPTPFDPSDSKNRVAVDLLGSARDGIQRSASAGGCPGAAPHQASAGARSTCNQSHARFSSYSTCSDMGSTSGFFGTSKRMWWCLDVTQNVSTRT